MAEILFTNTASALLNTTIDSSILTIELQTGFGPRFPSPSGYPTAGYTYFLATLEDDQGNFEVVKVIGRSNDLLTVATGGRGYDNSTAQAFTQNVTRVELRVVAAVMDELLQLNGDTMTGDLNMATNSITNAVITGASTQMLAGEIVNVPLRGNAGVATNELVAPAGGARATAGGANILVAGDDLIQYLDTAGTIDLSSATVGVKISDGYLRVGNPGDTEYVQILADNAAAMDMDFTAILDFNIGTDATLNINLGVGVDLLMNDQILDQAKIQDFSMTVQQVTAIGGTTDIDYELGNFVELDLAITTSQLSILNPPITGTFGSIRIRVSQPAVGGKLVTLWPTGTRWPFGGTTPTLSDGNNQVDYVDMWTSDAGVTWDAVFNSDWA